jgi:hypothetical protein
MRASGQQWAESGEPNMLTTPGRVRSESRIPHRKAESSGRAPVAQLDRAPVYETEGHRFESCRARSTNPAQPAWACGSGLVRQNPPNRPECLNRFNIGPRTIAQPSRGSEMRKGTAGSSRGVDFRATPPLERKSLAPHRASRDRDCRRRRTCSMASALRRPPRSGSRGFRTMSPARRRDAPPPGSGGNRSGGIGRSHP